ncbi:MAG: AraC family transcriptional regulator [bacterium]
MKINPKIEKEYTSRINRAIDYINKNLNKELTLDELACVANFSKFHFHRIFTSVIGETLNQFIQRLRLEKAAAFLISNPDMSITEISIATGFSSMSLFSRKFKEYFKTTPSDWRNQKSNAGKTNSNRSKTIGNTNKSFDISTFYIDGVNQKQLWRIKMDKRKDVNIEVMMLPEMPVAYIRHIGPYKGNQKLFEGLFERLFAWAGSRDLIKFPETKVLAVYYDDPEITEDTKLRVDVCISVPQDTKVDGEVGKAVIPGGKFAVGHFELLSNEYPDAWNAIMGIWLPQSGYQCDDRLCYELYLNSPKDHPEGKCIVDICVPVKPL